MDTKKHYKIILNEDTGFWQYVRVSPLTSKILWVIHRHESLERLKDLIKDWEKERVE